MFYSRGPESLALVTPFSFAALTLFLFFFKFATLIGNAIIVSHGAPSIS